MELEEIRKGLETGGMVKPERTFFVITTSGLDGPMYYMGEGGNGRPEMETQWTTALGSAAMYADYENLPREISNGSGRLRENAYGSTLRYDKVYPYFQPHGGDSAMWACAFEYKTRNY